MKKLIYTLLLTLAVGGANAQTISPKVAAQKAAGIFTKTNAAKGATVSAAEPQLAYVSVLSGDTCFYVFNNPQGGYAIIGGDMTSREILGIVDEGSFDVSSLPSQTVGWLSQYAKQIRFAKKAGYAAPVVTSAGTQAVDKLCTAAWGQDAPYSNYTPILPDIDYFKTEGYNGTHAATGCVATAAAQALYTVYKLGQNVPAHISKDISEVLSFNTEEDEELAKTETLTFSTTELLDWNLLTDTYTEEQTDDAAKQVGRLMYLMGLISKMGYGISSGAGTTVLHEGLQTYMGMSDAKYLSKYDEDGKTLVTDDAWEKTIYDDLAKSLPVVMTGNAKDGNGGHCFLCDGYNPDNNLFHINWGWNSAGDGYFALSATYKTADEGEGSLLKPVTGSTQTGDSETNDFGYGNEIIYNLVYSGDDAYTTSGIKSITSDFTNTATTRKYFDNGQLIIIKNGVKYNSVGQKL